MQPLLYAGWDYLDGLSVCPECGATEVPPPPEPVRHPAFIGFGNPFDPASLPRLDLAPPPVSVAWHRRSHPYSRCAGPLRFVYEEAHREKLYNGTLYFPPGCAVICDACDRVCRFVRPDGIAPPPDSIARTGKPQGPKRRWSVARFDDTAAGVVLAGQNMPSQIEVASGDHVNARTLLKYTQVIIDRALDSDLSLLPAWQHDAVRVEAVRRVRSAVHIPFKETKRE